MMGSSTEKYMSVRISELNDILSGSSCPWYFLRPFHNRCDMKKIDSKIFVKTKIGQDILTKIHILFCAKNTVLNLVHRFLDVEAV